MSTEEEEIAALAEAKEEQDQNRRLMRQRQLDGAMLDSWQDIPLPEFAEGMSLQELAEACEPMAIMSLIKVAYHGTSEAAKVAAANSILDRSKGKAIQQTKITVENADYVAMLDDLRDVAKGVYIDKDDCIEGEVIN